MRAEGELLEDQDPGRLASHRNKPHLGLILVSLRPANPRLDRLNQDVEISPHTVVTPASRRDITPWEVDDGPDHRKGLSFLNNKHTNTPPSQQPPVPSIPPNVSSSPLLKEPQYGRDNRPKFPPSIFQNSFYDSTDIGAMSPGFHPLNNDDYMDDNRRPSVASTSTMDSTASKRSANGAPSRFHKKLQGLLGEEYGNAPEERHSSDGSAVQSLHQRGPDASPIVERQGSMGGIRPTSRAGSQIKTREPAHASEVTPWVFQDTEVSV